VISVVRSRRDLDDTNGMIAHDLGEVDGLAAQLRAAGVTAVCHLAWVGHPRSAGMDFEGQIASNLVPSANLALAAGLAGVGHVVFISSGGAVAANSIGPTPAYGWAKLAVEGLYAATSRNFGYALTILRPTALMGPGQDPSGGLGVVTIFARQILRGEPIRIIGSPATSRDFLHVVDLAECIALVIERRATGTFEVGGPEVVRLDALVGLLERSLDRRAEVGVVEGSGVDPSLVRLDNTAITDAIGWRPYRTLAASLPEIVAYLATQLDLTEAPPRRGPGWRPSGGTARRGPSA
jgi:UDP-glucose 4-epimerase